MIQRKSGGVVINWGGVKKDGWWGKKKSKKWSKNNNKKATDSPTNCRFCSSPLQLRKRSKVKRKTYRKRAYHYSHYLYCFRCKKIFFEKKYIVYTNHTKNDTGISTSIHTSTSTNNKKTNSNKGRKLPLNKRYRRFNAITGEIYYIDHYQEAEAYLAIRKSRQGQVAYQQWLEKRRSRNKNI